MRILCSLILLLAACAQAQVTNIIGLEVETNGFILRATVGGNAVTSFGTNANFFSGLGTNYSLTSTTALTLTLTRMGFDDSGNGIQVPRVIYGTRIIRLPFGLQNTNDIVAQDTFGTNVVFRIALSDSVYLSDSNITATARGGWLMDTNGGVHAAATTTQAVTNSSTQVYRLVGAKWTWPGYRVITGSVMTVRLRAGIGMGARDRRPVRVVQIWATDTNGIAVTNFHTRPTVDWSIGDAVPVQEYVSHLSIASMSNGSPIRVDAAVYPWEGDTNSMANTFYNRYTGLDPRFMAQTNICDRLNLFKVIAVVADYGAVAGVVITNDLDTGSPPTAFTNISAAAAAIKNTNNIVYGISNCQAGIIYVQEGDKTWTGGTTTYGNTRQLGWLTILPYPTNAFPVVFTNTKNDKACATFMKIDGGPTLGITLVLTQATGGISDGSGLWVDRCDQWSPFGVPFHANTLTYITRSSLRRTQTLPFTASLTSISLMRGNVIYTNDSTLTPHCFVGNKRITTNEFGSTFLTSEKAGGFHTDMGMIADNALFGLRATGGPALNFFQNSNYSGFFIENNILEWVGSSAQAQPVMQLLATRHITNIVVAYNTVVGQRCNFFYNDSGSAPVYSIDCVEIGNLFDDDNIKGDTFTTGNGARIGNWGATFGVGSRGNALGNVHGIGTSGFSHGDTVTANGNFGLPGMNSYETINSATNLLDFYRFTSRQSGNQTATAGSGSGNYRLLSDSPLWRMKLATTPAIAFDIDGYARSEIDTPGANGASGNVRKGAFF